MRNSGWVLVAAACALAGCGGAPFTTASGAPAAQDDGGSVAAQDGGRDDAQADPVEATLDRQATSGDGSAPDVAGQDDGGGDGGSDAPRACVSDLSGVGAGDFRIEFTLTTTTKADVYLLSQSTGCSQPSALWSVSLNYNGQVAAGTGDGVSAQHWVTTTEANSVTDGQPHAIVFARTSGKIWISRDGVADSIPVDDPYSIGALPPLRVGVGDCSNFLDAAAGGAAITNVCLSE